MERPALFVGDAEEGEATLQEYQVRERMKQGLPAESAEEYLLRVRIESNDLPAVVEAHVPEGLKKKQTMYMPSTEPVPSCPAYLLPSEDWEREVLSTFVDLRQYLRRWKATAGVSPAERSPVPALKDNTGWHIFCLGYSEDGTQEEDSELGSTGGPALSEVQHSASSAAAALSSGSHTVAAAAPGSKDPRNDDDAQSSYCVAPVETSSRFDRFTATLSKTAESVQGDGEESETSATAPAPSLPPPPPPTPAVAAATGFGDDPHAASPPPDVTVTSSSSARGVATGTPLAADPAPPGTVVLMAAGEGGGGGGNMEAVVGEGGPGGAGAGEGVGEGGGEGLEGVAVKRLSGREWLRTHPHGTPPTMKLAIQFDQVLTQRVLAFHSEWLRDNLLSRARAVWLYTLLACLEKPLGSETAALVREVLRRCCAQRAEVESPQDENLPALNVIAAIAGKFFQQAEAP